MLLDELVLAAVESLDELDSLLLESLLEEGDDAELVECSVDDDELTVWDDELLDEGSAWVELLEEESEDELLDDDDREDADDGLEVDSLTLVELLDDTVVVDHELLLDDRVCCEDDELFRLLDDDSTRVELELDLAARDDELDSLLLEELDFPALVDDDELLLDELLEDEELAVDEDELLSSTDACKRKLKGV